MSYMRHIRACNLPIQEPFIPWFGGSHLLGWLRPQVAEYLRDYPAVFQFGARIQLHPDLQGFEQISAALAEVAAGLARAELITPLIDEPYPVTPGGRDAAIAVMDRSAAPYFGLRSFGQHLNGFVRQNDELWMWVARRAHDRLLFPGKLDNLVAGGLPHGIALQDNLAKECYEEAGMPSHLSQRAKPVGVLSYNRVAKRGFRPDMLYCYDIQLDADFTPINTDGEVESFTLLPIKEVMQIVQQSDDFKLNCNLVVIDFLIRHGLIGPEHPDYLEMVTGLHPPAGMPLD